MATADPFQPLAAVAESYISEASQKIGPETMERLKYVMNMFINGEISLEEANNEFHNHIMTTRPIDRVAAILNVSSSPISTNDNTNGNCLMGSVAQNNAAAAAAALSIMGGPRKKTHPWSEYEDQRLLAAIHKYGLDNWAPVSVFVGNHRTRAQCSQRWFRGLDPRISKVLWTADEESKLLTLIERYGDRAWTKISAELGNRSDAQCRYHYRQMMKEGSDQSTNSPTSTTGATISGGRNENGTTMSSLSLMMEQQQQQRRQINMVMSAPAGALKAEMAGIIQPQQNLLISQSPSTISRMKLPPISSILSVVDQPIEGQLPPLPAGTLSTIFHQPLMRNPIGPQ